MRQALTLLLIAMLACLGPVSGAAAHAHAVDADHHHSIPSPDLHEDIHVHRGTDREIDLERGLAGADTEAPESGDIVLHAHVHMDGAPIATTDGRGMPQRVGMIRELTNSAPLRDPGSTGPQRPPRTIL
ncbi:hypothetical protein [Maricaulis sp.]|uniref:hypothetical protein n=1 Tax=Maricaulis sp. TaxID=1486257 RepID=UPI0032999BE3